MAGENPSPKPLPVLQGLTGEFYGWCKKGELRFQQCKPCRAWRHVPREMCAECGSTEWEWAPSSGRGRVFTWTTTAVALHPAFKGATPYAPVVVEMDEGVRIVSEMVDCPPDELAIDMPVEVIFDAVTPEVTLPKFKRSKGSGSR
jgi:uncharacterized OB-fold protein